MFNLYRKFKSPNIAIPSSIVDNYYKLSGYFINLFFSTKLSVLQYNLYKEYLISYMVDLYILSKELKKREIDSNISRNARDIEHSIITLLSIRSLYNKPEPYEKLFKVIPNPLYYSHIHFIEYLVLKHDDSYIRELIYRIMTTHYYYGGRGKDRWITNKLKRSMNILIKTRKESIKEDYIQLCLYFGFVNRLYLGSGRRVPQIDHIYHELSKIVNRK